MKSVLRIDFPHQASPESGQTKASSDVTRISQRNTKRSNVLGMRLFGELQIHSVPFYICEAVVIHSSHGPETVGFQGYPRAHKRRMETGQVKIS